MRKFFGRFYLTALYPLAILKDGNNHNYYDQPNLYKVLKPHIKNAIKEQLKFGARKDIAISLGKKNAIFLNEINAECHFFDEIKVLDHPRYIMQYKLRYLSGYLEDYLSVLGN